MQLAEILLPFPLAAKQSLRLRRFKLAALSYALATVLLATGWMVGTLPDSAVLGIATAFVAINLGTYVAIRSGFNLRFRDPSLTRFQILAAITVLMFIVYKLDSNRHIVASVSFLVFLFGAFHLNTREYRLVTLYTLAAYALVINLLMHLRPQSITDVPGEWMSWLIIAGFLQCFAIIGGQMTAVRRKLRESEARFRSLTEMSTDFYWESDAEHRLTVHSANSDHSAESVFAKVEALGMRRWDTTCLSPDESAWQTHREALDAHLPFRDFTFSRLANEGSEHYISVSGNPVFDAAGEFVGYRGVGSDISERKRTEETLRQSEDKYRRLFEDAAIGIFRSTFEDRFIEVNPALAYMLGYDSPQKVIGAIHSISEQVYAEPPQRTEIIANTLISGKAVVAENRYRRKDGTIWIGNLILRCVNNAYGQPQYLEGFVEDITARKAAEAARATLEAQLRESQKMEALGTLAGGVAHDFNNALAIIMGNVELARQDVGEEHRALESLKEIGKASRRAKDLVQQILAFGRRQVAERRPTALSMVVLESARLLRASLPAQVNLEVECKTDTPAVLADATQVSQILLNLCSNAAQAVRGQERAGVIEIRLEGDTRDVTSATMRPGCYACLTVRDNGMGMDEATRSRIFEPFFTTKPPGQGTGLGLAVVHGIVEAHQGSIEVESHPGIGSTFRVYFPAIEAPAQAVALPVPNVTPIQGKGKHILYVDDEEGLVFLMKRLLERQGYRVSGYTDPEEALAVVRANPGQFDLVVTDYNMPQLSGLEVAQALKEIRPELPVLLASGYITEELRAKAPAAGVRELIYKPNTVDDLCAAVARYANAQSGKDISS